MSATLIRCLNLVRLGLLVVGFGLLSSKAHAQANTLNEKFGPEFSSHIGTLLPNQIEGVTEILPCWGARYSHPLSFGYVEGGLRDSHAKGVDFDVLSLDLRFDMNTVEGFTNIFYLGYDTNYYRPINSVDRVWAAGFHVGSGLLMKVASSFWIRTDMSLAVNPGTSLYLGLGFAIRTPAGGG